MPTITIDDTRSAWGAAPPSGTIYRVSLAEKDCLLAHYVDGNPQGLAGKPHADCLRKVKAFQTFHMGSSRGWSDIGYNLLICQHGRLIEGRGLLTVGAQCPNYNRRGIGVQFMVGGAERPTDVALARFARLRAELTAARGSAQRLMGHRDGIATKCPGDVIYAWLKAGAVSPIVTTPPPPVVVTNPTPTAPKVTGLIAEDGYNGPTTRKAIQRMLGVTVDGHWGPGTRKAIQRWAGVVQDGNLGPASRRAVQRKVGARVTGIWAWDQTTRPDPTTKALQAFHNRYRRNLAASQIRSLAMPSTNTELVQADAKNRALRSLVQGLGLDVAVAIAAALLVWLPSANIESGTAWKVLGLSLAKTVLQSVASYVMRAKLDGSSVPTPTPPEYPGEPADPVEADAPDGPDYGFETDPLTLDDSATQEKPTKPAHGWGDGI